MTKVDTPDVAEAGSVDRRLVKMVNYKVNTLDSSPRCVSSTSIFLKMERELRHLQNSLGGEFYTFLKALVFTFILPCLIQHRFWKPSPDLSQALDLVFVRGGPRAQQKQTLFFLAGD